MSEEIALPGRPPLRLTPPLVALCVAVGAGAALALFSPWPRAEGRPLSLPNGTGLAASYPQDRGIARDPRVLFAEDFEAGTIEQIGKRWDSIQNERGQVIALSADVPPASP